ncbi:MAG: LON peptidase substrate-binding domain-containing protein [Isosphaeraceae bacterium]
MEFHTELPDFSGRCRLFPLPNLVLFPHVILPLHIFEPRYRQMTRDALDGDQLVTMVQVRPTAAGTTGTEPVPIMDVACVGKIVQHERLPDGRFNILLLGCKRVRLLEETPSPKLYRIARAKVMEDLEWLEAPDAGRTELVTLALELLQAGGRLDADLSGLLHSNLPLGMLADIVAHVLELPASVKQSLLDEVRVEVRIGNLLSILRRLCGPGACSRPYPPPVSLN